MKKIVTLALLIPGTALAHPGHAELPGAAGHDMAHLVIGASIALAFVAGIALFNRRRDPARRKEE